MDKLDNMLGIRINVDSAERMIARTGSNAELFQDSLPAVEVVLDALFRVETLDSTSGPRPRPKQARFQACLSRSQEHPEDNINGEVTNGESSKDGQCSV